MQRLSNERWVVERKYAVNWSCAVPLSLIELVFFSICSVVLNSHSFSFFLLDTSHISSIERTQVASVGEMRRIVQTTRPPADGATDDLSANGSELELVVSQQFRSWLKQSGNLRQISDLLALAGQENE